MWSEKEAGRLGVDWGIEKGSMFLGERRSGMESYVMNGHEHVKL